MKATLTFNLPEETEEYTTAVEAQKVKSFLHEFETQLLRKMSKYASHPTETRELTPIELDLAIEIKTAYYALKAEYNITEEYI